MRVKEALFSIMVALALLSTGCSQSDETTESPTVAPSNESGQTSSGSSPESGADQTTESATEMDAEPNTNPNTDPAPFSISANPPLYGYTTRADSDNQTSQANEEVELHYLFLHGAAFQAKTWVDNGILKALTTPTVDATSIDLPGKGQAPSTDTPADQLVASALKELSLDPTKTVVIAPSMSGSYLLPGLRNGSLDDLAGVVLVAPVGAQAFVAAGPPIEVPALVIWGDGDGSDPQGAADALAQGFTNSEVVILANANHAAYMDQPDAFVAALNSFAGTILSQQ